jgi:transposase
MNGLIRLFFPKKMAFELISTKNVELAVLRLNHRSRKCLGYRTPHEVFMEQLQLHNPAVAVQTWIRQSLADIERGFRVLKSEIEIGPVYHRLPARIRAHAAICFMALILYRVMRLRLRAGDTQI